LKIKSDFSGLDEFHRKLKSLDGTNRVSFAELFDRNFMVAHTNFSSFEDLLEAGGYDANSEEDFLAIPDDEFDEHIRSVTKFSSWEEMQQQAAANWMKKKLL